MSCRYLPRRNCENPYRIQTILFSEHRHPSPAAFTFFLLLQMCMNYVLIDSNACWQRGALYMQQNRHKKTAYSIERINGLIKRSVWVVQAYNDLYIILISLQIKQNLQSSSFAGFVIRF